MAMREVTRVQIPSENGSEMVAVGPGMLGIHSLKPYSGWETYKPQIAEAIKTFVEIAKPTGIRRIGIRYINFIEPQGGQDLPSNYFTAPPHELDSLSCTLETFSLRHEYVYSDEPIKLVVNVARAESPEKKIGFVLDLDVMREWSADFLQVGRAMGVVEDLRRREREAFEALISEKSREMFDA